MPHNRDDVIKALDAFNGIVIAFNAISAKPLREEPIKTIRAALQSCLDDGWNYNIDEAPRDGTRILCVSGGGHVMILQWFEPQEGIPNW
jgi:hypothetical protein